MEKQMTSADFEQVFADLCEWNIFVNRYRSRPRLVWYQGNPTRERNGDHLAQMLLTADYLNERYKLGFDTVQLFREILAHDAKETYAHDTPVFQGPPGKYVTTKKFTRENKPVREAKSLKRIKQEWAERHPTFLNAIDSYDAQETEMSIFIYSLDKYLPCKNIFQDKGRSNHRLHITRKQEDEYKRPKIVHPFVRKLYEIFSREAALRPDLYHQEIEPSKTEQIAAE